MSDQEPITVQVIFPNDGRPNANGDFYAPGALADAITKFVGNPVSAFGHKIGRGEGADVQKDRIVLSCQLDENPNENE